MRYITIKTVMQQRVHGLWRLVNRLVVLKTQLERLETVCHVGVDIRENKLSIARK